MKIEYKYNPSSELHRSHFVIWVLKKILSNKKSQITFEKTFDPKDVKNKTNNIFGIYSDLCSQPYWIPEYDQSWDPDSK